MNLNDIKTPRKPRVALTHEQFFDLVQWLRAFNDVAFTSYTAAAGTATAALQFEVPVSSIKQAMAKAGVQLARDIDPVESLRRDLAIVTAALLDSGAAVDFEHRLRNVLERNTDAL